MDIWKIEKEMQLLMWAVGSYVGRSVAIRGIYPHVANEVSVELKKKCNETLDDRSTDGADIVRIFQHFVNGAMKGFEAEKD